MVQNETRDTDVHVYVTDSSHWNADLESAMARGGAEGFKATFACSGDSPPKVVDTALFSQCATIPPGHSHWFETARQGMGKRSRQTSTVCIATTADNAHQMRVKAVVALGSNRRLMVTLPVENGRVSDNPIALDSGGMLSQVVGVMNYQPNAPLLSPYSAMVMGASDSEKSSDLGVPKGGS